jgi:hypothetical protein
MNHAKPVMKCIAASMNAVVVSAAARKEPAVELANPGADGLVAAGLFYFSGEADLLPGVLDKTVQKDQKNGDLGLIKGCHHYRHRVVEARPLRARPRHHL